MRVYIYIGERLEVPRNIEEPCDTIIHVWSSNIQKGGGGISVLWTAVEQRCCYVDLRCGIQKGVWGDGGTAHERPLNCVRGKTLWRWRCCCVEDVAMLKMLFRWRSWKCCYVEDAFTLKMLKMLLCWRCCYVQDVATLKMFLRWKCWRCCYFEKRRCAFRSWFSGELWHLYGIHENTEILSTCSSTGFHETT